MGFNIQPTSYFFLVAISGVLFVWVDKTLTKVDSNLRKNQPVKQWMVIFLLLAKLGLMVALIGFVFVGFWWVWDYFLEYMSPPRLALYSLLIGLAPLVFPLLAKMLCKLTGGTVNAAHASGFILLGFDFNLFVYSLFMSYMLTMFTMGIAVFGLMISGIWALMKLF